MKTTTMATMTKTTTKTTKPEDCSARNDIPPATKQLRFKILPDAYAVAKVTALPAGWLQAALARLAPRKPALFSLTQTDEELSLVCPETALPRENAGALTRVQRDWRALKIEGPLDFSLVGILASVTRTLAQRRIPLFALSTHDTDYILVPAPKLPDATAALRADGHAVAG